MGDSGRRWVSDGLSDVGITRSINEDAFAELPERGLWVVADGMGGHDAGDLASRLVVESIERIPLQESLSSLVDAVEDGLLDVNTQLHREATARGDDVTIGSTVVTLAALGHHCAFLWAGDSRIYLLRQGLLSQLTRDHSEVMDLVEQGLLRREDAEFHEAANIVTRAVGAEDELYLDVDVKETMPGDRFLLCSDGLLKELPDDEIADLLGRGNCTESCRGLIDQALQRGARDNVSVVVVDFA